MRPRPRAWSLAARSLPRREAPPSITSGDSSRRQRELGRLEILLAPLLAAATTGLYTFDPAAALSHYRGPRLHIASFLADNPAAIHRAFKDMPVRVVRDASHWLMLDRPEEFNRALDDFLAEVK